MNIKNKAFGGKGYDDIIDLPHHVSPTRQRMKISDRAAQFAPFAALTGHGAAIKEAARLTDSFKELDENAKEILNQKLSMLASDTASAKEVSVTYFVFDEKKQGGAYRTETGILKKIKPTEGYVLLSDKKIYVKDIYDIESDGIQWLK